MSAPALNAGETALLERCDSNLDALDWSAAADTAQECLDGSPGLPEALERFARASRWLDELDQGFAALEQAFAGYRQRGDDLSAGRVASTLAFENVIARREIAVANGWFARAHELLDDQADPGAWGWLRYREAQTARYIDHDFSNALALALEAVAAAREAGDVVLEAAATALIGLVQVCLGEVEQGMTKLDKAGTAVVSGEVTTREVAGVICCDVIFACEHVRDSERAREWLRAASKIGDDGDLTPLIGACQMHYATLLMWEGDWSGAEQALDRARNAFEISGQGFITEHAIRLAQLRTLQGRYDDAWMICESLSWTAAAKLGQAQIAFARGEKDAARDLLAGFFASAGGIGRERLAEALSLRVILDLESGDRDSAVAAAQELIELADAVQTSSMSATAALANGRLAAHAGDSQVARAEIDRAIGLWMGARAPYDAATARLALAAVMIADGEEGLAAAERARAEAIFAELGGANEPATSNGQVIAGPLSAREREVLALVAEGLADDEIAARLVLSPHTVHRHVANIRLKLDEPTRAAAVAHASRLGLI
ncbi:MAG: response regulator transcription factor [Solirubrobacterales bacterium]